MRSRSLLGLCLSVCLISAGPAIADNGKSKDKPKNARAMQVMLDKKTGKKLSAPDDAAQTAEAAAETVVDTRGMMPVQAEPPQYHADGSMSARIGTENLKFLVVSIDEDGNKTLTHQPIEDVNLELSEHDKGEK
jgi:hypothetical protein